MVDIFRNGYNPSSINSYNDEFFDLDQTVSKIRVDQEPKSVKWAIIPLYNTDQHGNQRLWQVGFDGKDIIVRHGLVKTGNFVISKSAVVVNQSGRTIDIQALLEGRSRYNDKYVSDIYRPAGETSNEVQPSLAQSYPKTKIKIFPVAVQAKLNGERFRVFQNSSGVLKKLSRNNRSYDHVTHVDNECKILFRYFPGGTMIDGEMYSSDLPLNQIHSILSKVGHPRQNVLVYNVFDIYVPNMSFHERYKILLFSFNELFKMPAPPQGDKVALVGVVPAYSNEQLTQFRDKYISQGFEGIVIRRLGDKEDSFYKPGRTINLLKYKAFEDEEGTVVGVYESEGTESGLACFNMKDKNGVDFKLRPAGEFDKRAKWFKNPAKVIGRKYTFKHSGRSEYNVVQQPVGVGFRDED